jgi:hypothetical protein
MEGRSGCLLDVLQLLKYSTNWVGRVCRLLKLLRIISFWYESYGIESPPSYRLVSRRLSGNSDSAHNLGSPLSSSKNALWAHFSYFGKIKVVLWDHVVCVCVCPSQQAGIVDPEEKVIARQWLGKHVPATKNTQATTEEMLDAVLSMRSVSYQILDMQ